MWWSRACSWSCSTTTPRQQGCSRQAGKWRARTPAWCWIWLRCISRMWPQGSAGLTPRATGKADCWYFNSTGAIHPMQKVYSPSQKGEVSSPLSFQSVSLDASSMTTTLLSPLSLPQAPLPGMSSIHMLTLLVQEQIGLYFNTLDNYVRSICSYLRMILFERFPLLTAQLFGHVMLLGEIIS
jgi:hypothetical protein